MTVLEYVNKERRERKKKPLKKGRLLRLSARRMAKKLNRTHVLKHDAVIHVNKKFWWAGEVLGDGQKSSKQIVEEWMASRAHYDIIMSDKARRLGAAHVGKYWVAHLGRIGP